MKKSDCVIPASNASVWNFFPERKTYAHEPDLQDLIEYLQSDDITLIVNSASYLQHLSYSDEQVKVKVR